MTWSTRMRRRGVLMVAILALVLVLALSACGGRAAPNVTGSGAAGGNTSGQTTGGQSQSSGGNPAAQDLQSGDQQVQDAVSAMDNAQNNTGIDLSGQDNEVQP
jgi:hypothetical protein